MKCFNHHADDAVGICKICNKALCPSCTTDTGYGLACSASCAAEASNLDEIMRKNKLLLGIGSKRKSIPTGLLMFFFFGIMFSGFGLYMTLAQGRQDYFLLVMGLGFLAIGGLGWWRNRKINLSC
ncbi:MAG: hypothetical protein V7756_18355 [Halopseudomonas sp.]|uniref:hypothetical protein n=1 Tax=Halopseudomonas sp. TaxID=2901191 RepID=UPI0030015663